MSGTMALDGRWALITGAARRIGATIARTLHAQGVSVAIHYRGSAHAAEQLVAELNGERPDSALAVQADLLEPSAPQALVDAVVSHAGRLDILVNNASSFYPTALGSITQDQWDDLIGTNLKAPLFLCQAALPQLRANHGVIVNLADIHALRPLRHHPLYVAAKAGLIALTRALARDLAPEIRVNAVAPGAVLWPDEGLPEQTQQVIVRQVPLKRPGEPADVAACVLFLVRDAPYVTGQIIAVDGGRSVQQ